MIPLALVVGASSLVSLLLLILLGGLLAAVTYWILSLFTPHPIPAIGALVVFLVVVLYAVGVA